MEPTDTTVTDDEPFVHPETLQNETPDSLYMPFYYVTYLLQVYGWYLLFALIAFMYFGSKLREYFDKRKRDDVGSYKKFDANETFRRQEAMDAARRRLQDQHANMAEKYAEDKQKKDEEKRKAKIEDWNRHQQGKGYRSKVKSPEDTPTSSTVKPAAKKNVYKQSDYSPLGGESSSGASFRPPRRSGTGGGG